MASSSQVQLNETWSDRWPDHLWLSRFRQRCLRDLERGALIEVFNSSPPYKQLIPRPIPRRIWIYWYQGWNTAPSLVQSCLTSWIQKNPDWQVIALDEQSERQYATIGDLVAGKAITPAARSDLVRLSVLALHGGVWVDATTYCAVPLSYWLPHLLQSGFFAFSRPGIDRLLATWLLASEADGYLIQRWLKLARRYWNLIAEPDHYFWLHYLFTESLRSDAVARSIWAHTPQISADAPREVMRHAKKTDQTSDIEALLLERRVVVHKLDWRLPTSNLDAHSPLALLLKQ